MSAVTLPRSAVLKLLHLAQLGNSAGFITRLPDGSLKINAIQPQTGVEELRREFTVQGEMPFAFYRTAAQTGPDEGDIERWRGLTPLFLSVSVGTKGVLQLRGWQTVEKETRPVELSLAEGPAAQNSGVSRKA